MKNMPPEVTPLTHLVYLYRFLRSALRSSRPRLGPEVFSLLYFLFVLNMDFVSYQHRVQLY